MKFVDRLDRPRPIADTLCICTLAGVCLWVFGERSYLLGFYGDDAGYISAFDQVSIDRMLVLLEHYIPGRNLQMFWQYLLLLLTGTSTESLTAQHWIQTALISVNATACFLALRGLTFAVVPSFLGSAFFAFHPNCAEVWFWLQAIPLNLISTSLVLLLLLLAIFSIRYASHSSKRALFLLLAQFVLFFPAMFSYDQADGVAMLVCCLTAAWILVLIPPARLICVIAIGAYFLTFACLVYWKHRNPGGGPDFSHATLHHILSNLLVVYSVNFGGWLRDYLFVNLLPHSTYFERVAAMSVAFVILMVSLLCQRWGTEFPSTRACPFSQGKTARYSSLVSQYALPVMILIGAIAFVAVAYLPVLIWYVSPRHNYLPGLGLAAAIASALTIVDRFLLQKFPNVSRGGNCVLSVGLSLLIYISVQAILVEKSTWILSYQARKMFYNELAQQPDFKKASVLVLSDFPTLTPYGLATLGNQQATEVGLMTRGSIKMDHLVRSVVSSSSGAFIYVEPDQWGADAFLHFPQDKLFFAEYGGIQDRRIIFSRGPTASARYRGFTITKGGVPALEACDLPICVIPNVIGITLSFGPVIAQPNQVLAVRPLTKDGDKFVPVEIPSDTYLPRQLLIDVPRGDGLHWPSLHIEWEHSLARIDAFELFLVDEIGNRRIGFVHL